MVLAACGSDSTAPANSGGGDPDLTTPQADLTGAGSTFDQPFFTKAFYHYNQLNGNVTVTYASIGSGGGIKQFQATTVDFGATDVPMGAKDIAAAQGGALEQVPVTLGAVAIAYKVNGVSGGLHLSGDVLSRIFLGQITSWNDPAIQSLNSNVVLPSEKITVVHRSDGSGTTYIFTDYLSKASSAWKAGPGKGKTINWPVGVGGKGNEGVAGNVSPQNGKGIEGAIGYVELAYALQNNFTYAAIQNQAGQFVQPSLVSVAADAAQKADVSATDFSIVNEPGAASYPITGYSWVLIYQSQKDSAKGTALVRLFDWLTHAGQSDAQSIEYAPLPPNIQQLARTTLQQVVDSTGKHLLT
jgi:phosphate transport system substrate-binding protein